MIHTQEERMELATAATGAAAAPKQRLAWLDNIRWTVIAMVVLMHACVTYSGIGSWYFKEAGDLGIVQTLVFLVYQAFAQAFFMGILFFVAALFTPGAYDRKGFGRFLVDRFVRLGIPTLVYMLVLHPVTLILSAVGEGEVLSAGVVAEKWLAYVASGSFVGSSGPLWFAFALLAFSVVYAVVRLVSDAVRRGTAHGRAPLAVRPAPSARATTIGTVVLIAAIGAVTFLVRLVQPVGTSVLNMQLCYFTQYIALYCVGLWASRVNLIHSMSRRTGATWMALALAIGVPMWFLLGGFGGALDGGLDAFNGGMRWQAAAVAAWEAFFGVSFSIGLLVLYRERVNIRTRLTGLLADTSFGIYVFHAPVLVGVTVLLHGFLAWPLAKAGAAGLAAWVLSVAVAWVIQQVPGVRKIFR
jgi:glucans biosynthesis protein C